MMPLPILPNPKLAFTKTQPIKVIRFYSKALEYCQKCELYRFPVQIDSYGSPISASAQRLIEVSVQNRVRITEHQIQGE